VINSTFSDLESFKSMTFKQGLNIVLSEKSPDSTNLETRNRAGKTSSIELIHFCSGANADPKSLFRVPELENYYFGIDFDLKGFRVKVSRSGHKPNEIHLIFPNRDKPNWFLDNVREDFDNNLIVTNNEWKTILGSNMFSLNTPQNEDDESENILGPTFRSLFSYFVRRQLSGGFTTPVKQSTMQQLGDQQTAISYLLGLDWTIPKQWAIVRAREKSLKEIKKAAKEGSFGSIIGNSAELRTRLAVAEERTSRLRETISNFQVLNEYRDFEIEASNLIRQMGILADENTIDLDLIGEFGKSLNTEDAPTSDDLEELYKEVGIVLPDSVLTRFEDVRNFHDSVVKNRKSYLNGEIQSARQRIIDRDVTKSRLNTRYVTIMQLLKSHGALEQLYNFQQELSRLQAETEAIRQRLTTAEQLEREKVELDIERNQLYLRLDQDYKEQQEGALSKAIITFERVSQSLYKDAGSLTIKPSLNGPVFDVTIHGDKSKGITNMQIFCFDMMLMRLCIEQKIGPGYIIHDSHLFDGVDGRQVGKALEVGAQIARENGFQYIVTLNSDILNSITEEYPEGENLSDFILPARLNDSQNGGLFGIRFK